MSEQRNYAAEMAAYIAEHFMSAALEQPSLPPSPSVATLHALTDSVRRGSVGAFEALVRQLRPVLIHLGELLQPEDPQDLLGVLYLAVRKKSRTLPEIEQAIRQGFWSARRTQQRHARKVGALTLVHSVSSGAIKDKKTGELAPILSPAEPNDDRIQRLFDSLSDEDRYLWANASEDAPFAEIGAELGISAGAARVRWYRLRVSLQARLQDLEEGL